MVLRARPHRLANLVGPTDLIDYVDDKTRIARSKAADTLHSAAETLQGPRETIDRRIS